MLDAMISRGNVVANMRKSEFEQLLVSLSPLARPDVRIMLETTRAIETTSHEEASGRIEFENEDSNGSWLQDSIYPYHAVHAREDILELADLLNVDNIDPQLFL